MSLFAPDPSDWSPIKLRPYQIAARDAIEQGFSDVSRGLIATIFTEVARRRIERGEQVVVLAHRQELLEQARDRFHHQCPGISASIEGGEYLADPQADVIVASVQTVGREGTTRLRGIKPGLVICDEAHHAAADSYMIAARNLGAFGGGADYLGVTATPNRLDNKPLHGSEEAIFQKLFFDYPIRPAIRDGWLCDLTAFRIKAGFSLDGVKKTGGDYNQRELESRVNNDRDNNLAYKNWSETCPDRQTIVFCAGVDHAQKMRDLFDAQGVNAACVTGSTPTLERKAIMDAYRSGDIQVLTNCDVATEGFDAPDTSCILLLKPTQSWVKFVQMVGRGLRLAPGKEDCLVLDVAGTSDGKSLATIPGMLGLPNGMDASGKSAKELMDKFDQLSDEVKAKLAARQFAFGDLSAIIEKLDILADLEPSAELKAASRFAWAEATDSLFTLECGSKKLPNGERGPRRRAVASCTTLGEWTVLLTEDGSAICRAVVGMCSLNVALSDADARVMHFWPDAQGLIDRSAHWRQRSSKSEKQLVWLRKFGLSDQEIATMNGGQVSAFLDRKFAEKKNKR